MAEALELNLVLRSTDRGFVATVRNARQEVGQLSDAQRDATAQSNRASDAIRNLGGTAGNTSNATRTLASGSRSAGQEMRNLGNDADGTNRRLRETPNHANAAGGAFRALKGILGTLGLALTAANILSVNTAFASLRAGLETTTGSAELAEAALAGIQGFAAKTPYSVEEVTRAFIKLKNMGLDPSEAALTSYGNTAGAMSKSLNDMIEAVADAATGEFERLKEFGIKASAQGDRVKFTFKGVTTEVGKNAKEIQDYLINLGNTDFAGGMERQSKTLGGAFSNLGDSLDILFDSILSGTAESTLVEWIQAVASGVTWLAKDGLVYLGKAWAATKAAVLTGWIELKTGAEEAWIGIQAAWVLATEQITRAGYAAFGALQRGWVSVRGTAEIAWTAIKTAAGKAVEWVLDKVGGMVESIAKGLRFIGATESAAAMDAMAKNLKDGVGAVQSLDEAIGAVTQTMEDEKRQIDINTEAALEQALARDQNRLTLGDLNRQLVAARERQDAETSAIEAATVATFQEIDAQLAKQVSLDDVVNKLGSATDAQGTNTTATKAGTEATKAAKKAQDDYNKSLDQLLDRLDPTRKAAEEMFDALDLLDTAYQRGDITLDQYNASTIRVLASMGTAAETTKEWGKNLEDLDKKQQKSAKETDTWTEVWKNALKRVDDAFVDLWKSAFKGFDEFKDALTAAFQQMLAELAHKALTQKIVVAIGATLGVENAAASGISGIADAAGGGSFLGDLVSGAGSFISGIGSFVGTAITEGIGAAVSGALGSITSTFAGIGAAYATGGLGAAFAAAIPVIGWAVAAVSLLGSLGGLFAGNSDTTPDLKLFNRASDFTGHKLSSDQQDVAWSYTGGFGAYSGHTNHDPFANAEDAENFGKAMAAFGKIEDAVIAMVDEGTAEAIRAAVAKLPDIREEEFSGDGPIRDFFKRRMDTAFATIGGELETLYNNFSFDINFGDPQQTAKLIAGIALIDQATGTLGDVFDVMMETPRGFGQMAQEGEKYIETFTRLGIQFVAVNAALEQIGVATLPLQYSGVKAADALIQLFGGLEQFAKGVGTFYDLFHTTEEKTADFKQGVSDAFDQLGIAIPATREGFRQLVEGLDVSTEEGRQMFKALTDLAPAMDAFYKLLEKEEADRQKTAEDALKAEIDRTVKAAKAWVDTATAAYNAAAQAEQQFQAIYKTVQDNISAVDAYNDGQRSTYEALMASNAETLRLATSFDGTIESASALADSVQQRYQLELRMLQEVAAGIQSITQSFGATIERITTDLLAPEDRFGYYMQQANALRDTLGTLSDPAQITATAQEINRLIGAAYGSLDAEEKAAQGQSLIALLEEVQAQAVAQLEDAREQALEQAEELGAVVISAMDEAARIFAERTAAAQNEMIQAMKTAADVQKAAGEAQEKAAEDMEEASKIIREAAEAIPEVIQVQVSVAS